MSRSLLVAAFVLALGGAPAWPAVRGGHGGGFEGHRPGGGHAFHDHGHRGPRVFVYPYFYDPYWPYEPYYPPDYPENPYDAYCDPYSAYYAPQYCAWEGVPQ